VHPSDFFENCSLRTGIDTFEIFDEDLKQKLKRIHPKNFLKTKITLPVYKINLSYVTEKGNYKTVDRYTVMDSESDDEYVDFWIDMFIRDYNKDNPNHKMTKCEVNSIERICEAVLPLG
jgi:hypothetical protein